MANEREVLVPDIGDFHDVEVIEVLVKPGDRVEQEDSLITLESEKATMEVPAPFSGKVSNIKVSPGDKVSTGSAILSLATEEERSAHREEEAQAVEEVKEEEKEEEKETRKEAVPEEKEVVPEEKRPQPELGLVSEEKEVRVPDIGDFHDVEVIEVLVRPGDQVKAEDPLITLESEKATLEVPSPFDGTIKNLTVKVGDRVNEGTPLMTMTVPRPTRPAQPEEVKPREEKLPQAEKAEKAPAPEKAPPPERVYREKAGKTPHASPSVRRFARELGADIHRIQGSGPKGRILREDVQAFIKASLQRAEKAPPSPFALPPMPEIDFSQFGEIETRPLTRIQKLSGPHLHRSWMSVPHVTQHDEVDITDLEVFRKALKKEAEAKGLKLTFLPFLMKAVIAALKDYPAFNSSLDPSGEQLIVKKYYHIGFAVDTPEGLVVPVVRQADQKGIFALTQELSELSAKARDRKLKREEMQGASFTISSLGGIGGTAFTPIVNAPEVAILGVSRAKMQPVYQNGEFVPRLMLPLSLSYDHRVIDGATAARFTVQLGQVLADMRRILL